MRLTLVCALAVGAFVLHAGLAEAATITRSPDHGPPGTLVTVSGSHFPKNASVRDVLATSGKRTTVRRDGTFTVKFSVPRTVGGGHTIQAISGTVKATQPFTVTQKLIPSPLDVVPVDPLCSALGMPTHSTVSVTAVGFGATSSLHVTYAGTTIKDVPSSTAGTASFSFTVLTRPNDLYSLRVTDLHHSGFAAAHLLASGDHSCWSAAQQGTSTLDWRWDGVGWDKNTPVSLYYTKGTTKVTIASATTNTNGSFGTISRQTACPPVGMYPVSMSAVVQGRPVTVSLGNLKGC
jgi:hypothetical protein